MSIPTEWHYCGTRNLAWDGPNFRCLQCNQAGGSIVTCQNIFVIDSALPLGGMGGDGGNGGHYKCACPICESYLHRVHEWSRNPVGPEPFNPCPKVARFMSQDEETGIERYWREAKA